MEATERHRFLLHKGIDLGSWISHLASRHLMESGRSDLSLTSELSRGQKRCRTLNICIFVSPELLAAGE